MCVCVCVFLMGNGFAYCYEIYVLIYRVSQYSVGPYHCPIISAHSAYAYIQGVSIHMGAI